MRKLVRRGRPDSDPIRAAANEAREAGWTPLTAGTFNMPEFERVLVRDLYRWMERASWASVHADSRGKRRAARKLGWAMRSALVKLGEDAATASAALDLLPAPVREGFEPAEFGEWLLSRRYVCALSMERSRYRKRAARVIAATGWLLKALSRQGIEPHARASASAPPASASGGGVGYGERDRSVVGFEEGAIDEDDSTGEPVVHPVPDADAGDGRGRRAARDEEDDGWDD